MADNVDTGELISNRRSQRSCRLSTKKLEPNIEKQETEANAIHEEIIEEEDPPELFQPGDILWVHVSGNPWWPALLYGSHYEGNIHTKVVKSYRAGKITKRRLYFVYFFGPCFEYAWAGQSSILPYAGLDDFIHQAEVAVQSATKKHEQEVLADRYELKVTANKRAHWDQAIIGADEALKLPHEKRIENFIEILNSILGDAEQSKSSRKRHSSTRTRESRKTSSPCPEKATSRSSVKRQKTKSTSTSKSTKQLHVGLPILTDNEEKQIVERVLNHPKCEQLTLDEAQSFVCQLVTELIKESYQYNMLCVQIEWFYDLLLKHSEIIFKHSDWLNEIVKPMTNIMDKCVNPLKRKQTNEDVLNSSIFDILENAFQMGDLVWAKLNRISWWPAFVYGCYLENWKYVKTTSKSGESTKKKYFVYCFGSRLKHAWIEETRLHRYRGLEEFISYSENQIEQTTTKNAEKRLRAKFRVRLSEDVYPFWEEALKVADEALELPIDLRINVLEKQLHPLLFRSKHSKSSKKKKQVILIDRMPNDISSDSRTIPSQTFASSNHHHTSTKLFAINSSPKDAHETNQLSKPTKSKVVFLPNVNECESSDIVSEKSNSPNSLSSTSLTTAICHFLDKGIPSLTTYEEIHLVNELINHRLGASLTLTDAQLHVEQYVMNIALANYKHRMLFVQSEFFFEFLLKYPQIILKHRQWFKDFQQTLMPVYSDRTEMKKWQLATLLHAHTNVEQQNFH